MTTAVAASASTLTEIHKASIVNLFGFDVNVYGLVITVMAAIFFYMLYHAQKNKKLDWLDMITRDGTKVSTTKILQLVGGVVGTFIIIKVTLQGTLTWDLFAIYLSYVASIDGFSKLIMAKYGAEGSDDSHVPYPRRKDKDENDTCEKDADTGQANSQTVNITVTKPAPEPSPVIPPIIPAAIVSPPAANPTGGGAKAGANMPDD